MLKTVPGPGCFCSENGGSLNMAFTGKFSYMNHHFMLGFNPFDLRVDREGWWYENSCVIVAGFLDIRGC